MAKAEVNFTAKNAESAEGAGRTGIERHSRTADGSASRPYLK